MKGKLLTYSISILMLTFALSCHFELQAQTDPPIVIQKKPNQAPPPPPQNSNDPRLTKEKLAINYYTNKEYDKAAVIYEQLYEEDGRQYFYTYYLNCLIAINDYKTAEKLIKKQKKAQPQIVTTEVDEAFVEKLMGNDKKSANIISDLIDNLPDNNSQIIQIASALQSRGFFEEALLVYEKAREMPRRNYDYTLEMATAFQYTGDYEKMFDALLEHLDANPDDSQRVKNRMQSYLSRDVDDNLSGLLTKKLLEKAQANPNNLVYAEMLLWQAMQMKDFEMAYRQARAIDMRFKDSEEEMLEVAEVALSNKQYELAAKAFGYVKDKKERSPFFMESYNGYYDALVLQAEANPATTEKQYRILEKEGLKALEELGINRGTIVIANNLAHIMAFRLGEYEEATNLLEKALEIPAINPVEESGLKLELADILLFRNKEWDATLLYSQIESEMKNEPVGHEAKFRNARLFYYIGEYQWSQTKLDILKSATSKLIANDAMELSLFIKDVYAEDTLGFTLKMFGQADLMLYRGKYDSSLVWLEKIEKDPGGINTFQHLIYKKAGIMEVKQDYVSADSLYTYLYTQYPESIKADNAIFKRAELNRQNLNNEETAMELYLILMRDYPDSIYAGEARIRYRALREKDKKEDLTP